MIFWERVFQKYGLSILCFKTRENVGKRVDIKFVEKMGNVLSGGINWNIIGTEFCKVENGKPRIVRSWSRSKVLFNKPFFVVFFILDLANLKMYESYTTFFYPFDFSNGIKLRYRYTDSRIMSFKSADIDEVFVFLQN